MSWWMWPLLVWSLAVIAVVLHAVRVEFREWRLRRKLRRMVSSGDLLAAAILNSMTEREYEG